MTPDGATTDGPTPGTPAEPAGRRRPPWLRPVVVVVIGVVFLAYPLTLPPMMGLGIFDVVLLGAFMEIGGDALESELVAALTVWRAVTILGPVVLGGIVTLGWRRRVSAAAGDAS